MRKYFISVLFILLLCASAILILAPPDTDSIADENRELKTFPEFSMENIWSGKFSSDFEGYVDDNHYRTMSDNGGGVCMLFAIDELKI